MNEICFMTALELRAALQEMQISARDVIQAHLEQIELVNPKINAIITLVAERAISEAAAADQLRASGRSLPPLHGLPVAHKDLHDTAGIRTTYGSPLHASYIPERNHIIIDRMQAAGAITIGKTNVPEFGAGSHTYNTLFGVTRNPYNLAKSAGGSSGGAAAALAAGMQPIADGSDTGGSLRNPASFNNVVGFRPSPGRVPNWPTQLAWSTLSVKGPMARTVADASLLLSVIAGPDARSPISLNERTNQFASSLNRDMNNLKIAWSPDFNGMVPVEPEVASIIVSSAQVFADMGCTVIEDCPDLSGADEVFRTLRAWQFEIMFGKLIEQNPGAFKESIRQNTELGRQLSGPDLGRAEVLHTALFHRVREFFSRYDALLLPVAQVPPFDIDLEYPSQVAGTQMGDYLDWMRSCSMISVIACPALSVPAGFTADGLPVGLQIVGPHGADLAVLQFGHAFEQATNVARRRPPHG